MKPTLVLLTDSDLGDRRLEVDLLREHIAGVEVVTADCRTEDDVIERVRDFRPTAIVTQWAPITSRVLDEATGCKVVSRVGIGLDMVDVAAAARLGIEVRNVPHYCTEEVASHAVALALALWRKLPEFDTDVRNGRWDAARRAPGIGRLSDATVGLVGAGRIGTSVAAAFAAWGTRVVVHDPAPPQDAHVRVDLPSLAAESDIISLHAPLTDSTHHLIDSTFIAQTRTQPVIVNTSRGGLVDLGALSDGLANGQVAGAGLDVFEDEPLDPAHPITEQSNTILTPHAAWCSRQALPELRRQSVMNVVQVLTAKEETDG